MNYSSAPSGAIPGLGLCFADESFVLDPAGLDRFHTELIAAGTPVSDD